MSLELTDLSKSFKDDTVLDGVSLHVPEGKTLVLFGPSGAGKTVLLRLIAGVIEPDTGQIKISGMDVDGVAPEDRNIGMAFQNFALFPHMDAHANIASPLTAQKQDKSAIQAGVQALAKLLKIDHVLGHKPKELSNGQKQRTALARALAGKPKILLLDDPLRNVDAKLRFEMRLELPRLLSDQNATVVYVTQDYKEAMAFGDEIAVINGGVVQQIGTPEQIYLTPANVEIARLFGDPVINFLDVTPQKDATGVFALISDKRVDLDAGYSHVVGQDCSLGIRPESVLFVPEDHPGAVPVTVEAETPLNEKTVNLCLTARGREIMASRPSGTDGPAIGAAFVTIEAANALLFDKLTGALIEPTDIAVKGKVA
ncbi:ABC transporter ATP-binding protein [Ruegeria sp. EL01]|jgi:multiple sugar transport system ATP-binding protein|uniref:ABC transporter ATP-binding protein n=1 Tax=Ruegeria sp. EL01 TaxID=2107578 RepID=UPI0013C4C728|nr:ABC transporter ATP-binding protein [Ruegeria sp. EL01]